MLPWPAQRNVRAMGDVVVHVGDQADAQKAVNASVREIVAASGFVTGVASPISAAKRAPQEFKRVRSDKRFSLVPGPFIPTPNVE